MTELLINADSKPNVWLILCYPYQFLHRTCDYAYGLSSIIFILLLFERKQLSRFRETVQHNRWVVDFLVFYR